MLTFNCFISRGRLVLLALGFIIFVTLARSEDWETSVPSIDAERLLQSVIIGGGEPLDFRVLYHNASAQRTWLESADLSVRGVLSEDVQGVPENLERGDLLSVAIVKKPMGGSSLSFRRIEGDEFASFEATKPDFAKGGFVELLAYVEEQGPETSRGINVLGLAEGRRLQIRSACPFDGNAGDLLQKFASVRGVLEVDTDPASGRASRTLWILDQSDIESLDQKTKYLFSLDPWGISEIPVRRHGEYVRSVGRLRASEKVGHILFEDSSRHIEIETEQASTLQLGVPVELVFEAREQGKDNVGNPVFRPLSVEAVEGNQEELLIDAPAAFMNIGKALNQKERLALEGKRIGVAGSVTLIGPRSRFAILQDKTGILRILLPRGFKRKISIHDIFYVEGLLSKDDRVDAMVIDGFARLGKRPIPEAALLSSKRAALDSSFQTRIAVEGYVKDIRLREKEMIVDVMCADGEIAVWVRSKLSEKYMQHLRGSLARFEGVSLGKHPLLEGDQSVLLGVASGIHIDIVESGAGDVFERDAASFGGILEAVEAGGQIGFMRTSGAVLQSDGSRRLVLNDGRNSLDVLLPEAAPLTSGNWLDVVGVPGQKMGKPILRVVSYREDTAKAPIVAQELIVGDEDFLTRDAALVKYEGEVLSIHEDDATIRLMLSDGKDCVMVILGSERAARVGLPFKAGDTVEAVGILRVLGDPISGLATANIVLRGAGDLSLVRPGPFWTAPRLVYLIVFGLFVMCSGALLVFYLRLKVKTNEFELEQQRSRNESIAKSNRRIMDQASDFMFTVDRQGRLTSFNAAGQRITGFTRSEALEMTLFDLLDRREAKLASFALRRSQSQEIFKSFKTRFRTKDGRRIWLEVSPSLIEEAGEIKGGLVIARDVTREMEEREALERAKAAAEANADAKARFLATMSHELRTPMNGMIGMMNILLDTKLTSEQVDCVKIVLSSSQALHAILSSILDYSKLESGAMVAEVLPFDPKREIDEAFKLMSASAVAKSIGVSLEGIEALPDRLLGDAGRLRQIIINLLGNAIKFTERGSVGLSVEIASRKGQQVELLFEILDTGIGVDEGDLERLFTPFQQADSSHSRRFGGTGLGLTISRQLVELLGGEIGAESKKGVGSRFWFRLPFELDASQLLDESKSNGKSAKSNQPLKGAELKVLVAEDTPVNQKIILMQLKKIGLQADLAENGEEAVEAVERTCYDLILMDCQMPKLDGWEATQIIRKSERNMGIAIIAVTANCSEADQQYCKDVGMDGFVGKPTSPKKLLDEIESVLAKKGKAIAR